MDRTTTQTRHGRSASAAAATGTRKTAKPAKPAKKKKTKEKKAKKRGKHAREDEPLAGARDDAHAVELEPLAAASLPRAGTMTRKAGRRDIYIPVPILSPAQVAGEMRARGETEEEIRRVLDEMRDIARGTVDALLVRGERLHDLDATAAQLVESGFEMRGQARGVRRTLCRQRCVRCALLAACALLVLGALLVFVYVAACGWTLHVAACVAPAPAPPHGPNTTVPPPAPAPAPPPAGNSSALPPWPPPAPLPASTNSSAPPSEPAAPATNSSAPQVSPGARR